MKGRNGRERQTRDEVIAGQRERIRTTLASIKAGIGAIEIGLADTMGIDVEAGHNLTYMAVRLVTDMARLFQMEHDRKEEKELAQELADRLKS